MDKESSKPKFETEEARGKRLVQEHVYAERSRDEHPLLKVARELETKRPKQEDVDKAVAQAKMHGFTVGKSVSRKHDSGPDMEKGEIVGHNNSLSPIYPGTRYPIIVQFPSGKFEYGEDELELLPN